MGACRSKSKGGAEPKAVLVWHPLDTKIGKIFYLDRGKSLINGLKAAAYVSQSSGYVFLVGAGAVGRCYANGSEFVVLDAATRFDEFHRAGPARDNDIRCVYLVRDGERIFEYVNACEKYASTEDVAPYEEVVRGMAGAA